MIQFALIYLAGCVVSFQVIKAITKNKRYYKDRDHPTAYEKQRGDFVAASIFSWILLLTIIIGCICEYVLKLNDNEDD